MKYVVWALGGLTFLVVASVVYFWTMQNAPQVAQLSLDLARFGGWRMEQPMQVTTLMGLSFGFGFLLATVFFLVRSMFSGQPRNDVFDRNRAFSGSGL
jgi:hypothetical protein